MAAVPVLALSEAAEITIVNIVIWGVVFPALVTGLIAFALIKAFGERQDNEARRHRKRRAP